MRICSQFVTNKRTENMNEFFFYLTKHRLYKLFGVQPNVCLMYARARVNECTIVYVGHLLIFFSSIAIKYNCLSLTAAIIALF